MKSAVLRTVIFLLSIITGVRLNAQIASFPGAVGFGGTTTGATTLSVSGTSHYGGTVYHVTNLNDSGAGSFRAGVATSGNIVVFDVGGSIQALSPISTASNLTIAGQTAPGGIQIFGAEVSFYGQSSIVCRYVHFRNGTLDPNYPGASATDSHTNAASLGNTTNVIMDDCSFEFAAYNNVDAVGAVNVTFQNCIFADPIKEQQFNCHYETGPVTFIDDLWANSHGRNPLGKANLQYVNNIVYNYGYAMTTGNSSGTFLWDVVNNYFISGPSTNNAGDAFYQVDASQSAYAIGNYLDGNNNGVLNGSADNSVNGATDLSTYWSSTTASLPTVSATAAYYDVVSTAGPAPRDQVDTQIVSNVLSLGTAGTLWTNQANTGLGNSGYGVISSGTALPDSDASGMPDDWKAAMGLSLTNPAIGNVTSSTGYTNLENYLNWKAQPNAWVAKNTASQPTSVTVDLSQFANGFANGSTYTVSSVVSGSATQSGTGGHLVTFVPTTGTSGFGGLNWSVANGVTTLTSTFGILVSQSGPSQSVIWKGDGVSNYWDSSTMDWTSASSGSSAAFGAGDPVNFNDSGSASPAVNINTAVSPGSITVNNYSSNYTLSGTGVIGGSGALVKEGSAPLTVENSGTNTFSGGAILNSGTVTIYSGSALGSGTTALNGATLNLISSYPAYLYYTDPVTVNEASALGVQGSNVYLQGVFSGSAPLSLLYNSNITLTPEASWSGYSGTVTVSGAGTFRIQGATFPSAVMNFQGAESISNNLSYSTSISFGALNGISSTTLSGGPTAGTVATYIIGGAGSPSTFAGTISNSSNETVAITATGSQIISLTGSSTYTGATTVGTGNTLLMSGSLGKTAMTVQSSATLIANGTVAGSVTLDSGGSIYLGSSAASGNVGTLVSGSNMTLSSGAAAYIYYDLSNSPTATGSNDLITVNTGTLSMSGTTNVVINLTNGVLGVGTYSLINGNSTLSTSGTVYALDLPIPPGGVTRQNINLVRPVSGTTPAYVDLVVTGTAGSLVWSGTNGASWDLNTTSDWSGASPGIFYDLDSVTFNDTDSGGSVALTGSLAPVVLTVSGNFSNYTFTGTGGLAGSTQLIKSGSSTLTIQNAGNTFTGPIDINAGTLVADAYLGTGTIYLNGGVFSVEGGQYLGNSIVVDTTSTIYSDDKSNWVADSTGATLSSTSNVTLNIDLANGGFFTVANDMSGFQGIFEMGSSNGTVRLNGSGSALALFDIGTGTGVIGNRNGGVTENFGAVQGGSGTTLSGRTTGSGATISTYYVGALNTSNTFAGTINSAGDLGGLNIFKVGTGNWILSGTSTFAGDVLVEGGTMTIPGSLNNEGLNFEAQSGATLVLAGGTISTEVVQIDQGAFFTGYGTIYGGLLNEGTNSLTNLTGNVIVTGSLAVNGNIENDGAMTVASGGTLYLTDAIDGGATFVNNGTLDLRNSPQTALPVGYVNNGTILTSGSLLVIQSLVWAGDGVANAWNASATNWIGAVTGTGAAFSVDDPVTFTDGGSTVPAVNISTIVSPQSVEVSGSSSNFSFSGSGGIAGATGLEKDSSGSLTLASANSYTGPTALNSGTLQLRANSGNTAAGVSSALSLSSTLTQGVGTTLGFFGNTNGTIFAPAAALVSNSTGATFNLLVGNNGSGVGNTLVLANVGQFGGAAFGGTVTYNLSGSNGYTLQLGSGATGTGMLSFYNNTVLSSNAPGVTLSIPGGLVENYPLSYTLVFLGPGNVNIGPIVPYSSTSTEIPTFASTGTVTLTGSNTYTGITTVNSGIVALAGSAAIADTTQILIANASGTAAALYQSGTGSLVANTSSSLGDFQIGATVGAAGYYNLSGGTVDVSSLNTSSGGEIDIGGASGGASTFGELDMTGGIIVLPNQTQTYFLANRGAAGETAVVNFLGGTLAIAAGATPSDNGIDGIAANWTTNETATITVGGTAQVLTPSLWVKLNVGTGFNGTGTGGDTAILNLDGGTLQTFGIKYTGTNSTVNFDGGTLEAGNAGNSSFMTGLLAAYVYAGGGTINNNGQAISIAQSLLAVSGSRIAAVAISSGGTGYTVPPAVSFNGGGGMGASAYATISATSGAVTGIVITNPGTGYASAPSVTLIGITGGTAATTGGVVLAANTAAGGMAFSGTGTTTLTAVETYTGPTVINSGTLAIANATNAAVSGINASSVITINNGGTININTTTDNVLLGSSPSATAQIIINSGGAMTTSDSGHLDALVLAGGQLAENSLPSADQAAWGVYNLDHGVTAGGSAATSIISARDVGLTENGGTVFNVSPGSTNGIDLDVTGGFSHLGLEGNDNGLIKTGNGVMLLAGTSNYLSATVVNAGTLGVTGTVATTAITVSGTAALVLSGGVITTGTMQIAATASLVGYGSISGTLVNLGTTTVNGPLTVNGSIQNSGTMMVTGSGSIAVALSSNGTFVNNGLLDIMDSPQTSLPAGFINNGTVLTESAVKTQQIALSGSDCSVTMQSYSGHTYQLERSTDLMNWTPIGNAQTGSGSLIILTDTNATVGGLFYRVGVGP